MTKRATSVAASLLLAGCSDGTPPSAYKHARDRLLATIPLVIFDDDLYPCFRTIDGRPARLPDAECYRLTDAQRLRGVARTGFEAGSFYPGRTTLPQADEQSDLWIELDPSDLAPEVRRSCTQGCAVYLDFIGRRTAVPGSYGHMGSARHLIIVDRVLSARILD